MMENAQAYLELASGAMSRGDYLNAIRFARRASAVPMSEETVRCDAYMLLALTSIEMGLAEDALAFAVGAHLAACRVRCPEREQKAASIVAVVISQCPQLGEQTAATRFH